MRRILRRVPATGAMAAAALWMWADVAAAHGMGGRLDLPVPLWQLAWAASFAVAASFVALGMFWNTPKFRAAASRAGPPRAVPDRLAGCRRSWCGRSACSRSAVLLYAGLAGNTNPSVNIAPVAVYIIFWVGLQVVSVLVGDVWLHLSPFTTIADGCGPAASPPPRPAPSRLRPGRRKPLVGHRSQYSASSGSSSPSTTTPTSGFSGCT